MIRSLSSVICRPGAVLRVELALRLRQSLRFDQQPLPFVAASALAEAHHHGMPAAQGLGTPGEQRISCAEKVEIVKTDAAHADRAWNLHHEKAAGAATTVALPFVVQWLDHDQLGRTARFLRQALALFLRELR